MAESTGAEPHTWRFSNKFHSALSWWHNLIREDHTFARSRGLLLEVIAPRLAHHQQHYAVHADKPPSYRGEPAFVDSDDPAYDANLAMAHGSHLEMHGTASTHITAELHTPARGDRAVWGMNTFSFTAAGIGPRFRNALGTVRAAGVIPVGPQETDYSEATYRYLQLIHAEPCWERLTHTPGLSLTRSATGLTGNAQGSNYILRHENVILVAASVPLLIAAVFRGTRPNVVHGNGGDISYFNARGVCTVRKVPAPRELTTSHMYLAHISWGREVDVGSVAANVILVSHRALTSRAEAEASIATMLARHPDNVVVTSNTYCDGVLRLISRVTGIVPYRLAPHLIDQSPDTTHLTDPRFMEDEEMQEFFNMATQAASLICHIYFSEYAALPERLRRYYVLGQNSLIRCNAVIVLDAAPVTSLTQAVLVGAAVNDGGPALRKENYGSPIARTTGYNVGAVTPTTPNQHTLVDRLAALIEETIQTRARDAPWFRMDLMSRTDFKLDQRKGGGAHCPACWVQACRLAALCCVIITPALDIRCGHVSNPYSISTLYLMMVESMGLTQTDCVISALQCFDLARPLPAGDVCALIAQERTVLTTVQQGKISDARYTAYRTLVCRRLQERPLIGQLAVRQGKAVDQTVLSRHDTVPRSDTYQKIACGSATGGTGEALCSEVSRLETQSTGPADTPCHTGPPLKKRATGARTFGVRERKMTQSRVVQHSSLAGSDTVTRLVLLPTLTTQLNVWCRGVLRKREGCRDGPECGDYCEDYLGPTVAMSPAECDPQQQYCSVKLPVTAGGATTRVWLAVRHVPADNQVNGPVIRNYRSTDVGRVSISPSCRRSRHELNIIFPRVIAAWRLMTVRAGPRVWDDSPPRNSERTSPLEIDQEALVCTLCKRRTERACASASSSAEHGIARCTSQMINFVPKRPSGDIALIASCSDREQVQPKSRSLYIKQPP